MQALRLSLAGAFGAFVAWLISEPFAHTANEHGTRAGSVVFTLGSVFGLLAFPLVGAFVVCGLTAVTNSQRMKPSKTALMALASLGVGGLFGWLADSNSDRMMIAFLRGSDQPGPFLLFAHLIWSFLYAMALAMAVALCTSPTRARVLTLALGGLGGAVFGFIARMVVEPFVVIFKVIGSSNSRTVEAWTPFDVSRLAEYLVISVVLALSIALADRIMTSGTLRLVLGRNEGRTYGLGPGVNRIGAAEGIEVPIFDMALAPVQALVRREGGQFLFENVGGTPNTSVNGSPAMRAALRDGDVIQIDKYTLLFSTGKGGAPVHYPVAAPYVAQPVLTPPPAAYVAPPTFLLCDAMGNEFILGEGATVIGREANLGVSLTWEPTVSRRHAEVRVSPAGVTITDLGSANGTFVNGSQVGGPTPLQDADQVRLGQCLLTFRSRAVQR